MRFASVRLITNDVDRLVTLYELVTGMTCNRQSPVFAENDSALAGLRSKREFTRPGCD